MTGTPGAVDLLLLLASTAVGATLASACAAVLVFRLLTLLPAAGGAMFVGRFEPRLLL